MVRNDTIYRQQRYTSSPQASMTYTFHQVMLYIDHKTYVLKDKYWRGAAM